MCDILTSHNMQSKSQVFIFNRLGMRVFQKIFRKINLNELTKHLITTHSLEQSLANQVDLLKIGWQLKFIRPWQYHNLCQFNKS